MGNGRSDVSDPLENVDRCTPEFVTSRHGGSSAGTLDGKKCWITLLLMRMDLHPRALTSELNALSSQLGGENSGVRPEDH